MPKTSKSSLPLRPYKTIDWLSASRDDWKEKTLATKAELKVAKQAQKRAQVSRKQWKQYCKELKEGQVHQETMLKKKDNEIAELEAKIIHLKQENEELKKSTGLLRGLEDRATHIYRECGQMGIALSSNFLGWF